MKRIIGMVLAVAGTMGCDRHKTYLEKTAPVVAEISVLDRMLISGSDEAIQAQMRTTDAEAEKWKLLTKDEKFESREALIEAMFSYQRVVLLRDHLHWMESTEQRIRNTRRERDLLNHEGPARTLAALAWDRTDERERGEESSKDYDEISAAAKLAAGKLAKAKKFLEDGK